MEKEIKKRLKYVSPRLTTELVELEQGIAAGSANINTGKTDDVPNEREFNSGWSNGKDFDI
ncbi:hypothetical protein OHD16_13195 [Sphingobacterium sp. ML3W]|uniref:hypothetical protein n=1 Tax=Sphingobacterium sp. ML3W TaxID=1538644 RepID=UPI00249C6C51|nr:hypothetical protein [Sphingobacterium sp. ML3W]WFA80915.1 hypothetical protein OGI71_06340 [Sphingobacterium sp. ML3W]